MQNSWCSNGADVPRIYHLCRARRETREPRAVFWRSSGL
ncbi:hypothetical protein BRPE64_ACDS23820 [Caballeronia insecticola]|uniref:Uncharacterized protein n=1 Tax=Caballeronia insecticola TaxID=758793 RepID=R4WY54_9BURK|nr:hypothetical protein BRPE64_ACDS23820 [Caballeronia insecticola]